MTVTPNPDHPARFSEPVLEQLQALVVHEGRRLERKLAVLDPFAGVGRIHELRDCFTTGVEIEPEWAACRPGTIVGDATVLPTSWTDEFDAAMTSPCYGNRMRDHHNPKDGSKRRSYKFSLGHDPHEESAATMRWDEPRYRDLHQRAYDELRRVVQRTVMVRGKPTGGLVVVNMSNHLRTRNKVQEVQPVVELHITLLAEAGLYVETVVPVRTERMRMGANHQARYPYEHIIVCRNWKPAA